MGLREELEARERAAAEQAKAAAAAQSKEEALDSECREFLREFVDAAKAKCLPVKIIPAFGPRKIDFPNGSARHSYKRYDSNMRGWLVSVDSSCAFAVGTDGNLYQSRGDCKMFGDKEPTRLPPRALVQSRDYLSYGEDLKTAILHVLDGR